mmetsp:Transcript_17647/g.24639  ORF Transcript_17647/g.24639 Transcript_17647/m.24639 type:complete len:114 (-) Transcript_17647:256-597(-)
MPGLEGMGGAPVFCRNLGACIQCLRAHLLLLLHDTNCASFDIVPEVCGGERLPKRTRFLAAIALRYCRVGCAGSHRFPSFHHSIRAAAILSLEWDMAICRLIYGIYEEQIDSH